MTQLPDEKLVSELIAGQFPDLADQPVSRLQPGGWDNLSFRLGETMLVKLPRDREYAGQPTRECGALKALGGTLPLQIPKAIALGTPSENYPHHWSILEWIEGETVTKSTAQAPDLPGDLAHFLRALHDPAPTGAPEPGDANFWRGGSLIHLTSEFEAAARKLASKMDMAPALAAWEDAIACQGPDRRYWVHGDIAPANLLQRDGKLYAVIDFGLVSSGDPACDLAIAWLAFDPRDREAFLNAYGTEDRNLLARGRAWALWKAVLVLANMSQQPLGYLPARTILDSICRDNLAA